MGLNKFIRMCIHHYDNVQESFTDLNILCVPPIPPYSLLTADKYVYFHLAVIF